MKSRIGIYAIIACPLLAAGLVVEDQQRRAAEHSLEAARAPISVEPYFSPKGGCTRAIVEELERAKSEVHVAAYSFTSREISAALIAAHQRRVKVLIIADKSDLNEKYSRLSELRQAGIDIYIDSAHAIFHDKFVVIDGAVVLTGSFNYTFSAETHNAENLLVIHNQPLAKSYLENWKLHLEHSEAMR